MNLAFVEYEPPKVLAAFGQGQFDGRPWPTTPQERDALLAQLGSLPPLLTSEEADRFEAWRGAEKERQRALSTLRSPIVGQLFT